MSRDRVTAALGVTGWIVSYALFLRWLAGHDWDFFGGWLEAFTASDFATALIMDLVFVTVMLIGAAWWERDRIGHRWSAAVVASLALSVSVSLAILLVRLWQVRQRDPRPPGSASGL